jgi:phosphoserine phosphatase
MAEQKESMVSIEFSGREHAGWIAGFLDILVDSTLLEMEIIHEIAVRAGVYEQVKEITSRSMHGAFDFKTALIERIKLLTGLGIG